MASPVGDVDREAAKNDWAGLAVRHYITMRYPPETLILDVGAGWGKYRDLLPEYPDMDAIEVWQPYVEQEQLGARYRMVRTIDVADATAEYLQSYGLVVFGDVLEHLRRLDAQRVIRNCRNAVVVVPFRYHQGEEGGNPYEKHWQDDLTPRLMRDLYPELRQVAVQMHGNRPFKGLYVKEQD